MVTYKKYYFRRIGGIVSKSKDPILQHIAFSVEKWYNFSKRIVYHGRPDRRSGLVRSVVRIFGPTFVYDSFTLNHMTPCFQSQKIVYNAIFYSNLIFIFPIYFHVSNNQCLQSTYCPRFTVSNLNSLFPMYFFVFYILIMSIIIDTSIYVLPNQIFLKGAKNPRKIPEI